MSAPVIRQVATFLFCDQVGSTALLEQLGEASSDELRRDLFATLRRPIDASGFGFVPVSDATPAISSSTSSTGPDDDQTLPPPWGLASSPSPDGGVRVADVSDTLIHWSDGGEQPSGYLDPGLGYLWALALAPDGRTAIVEADAGFALVALDGRSSLERSSVPLGDASFTSYVMPSVSPDGSRLALLTGPVETMTSRVVDLASGEPVGPSVRGRAGFVDDRTLVAGSFDPNGLLLRRLDVATGAPAGETLITGFTPTELASEDAATGR